MNDLPKIYISPINEPILNAILKSNKNIGLIFSQRQCDYNDGYINKNILTKSINSGKILGRDHFCVKNDSQKHIDFDSKIFHIIHLDPWFGNKDANIIIDWIFNFKKLNNNIKFEFGTEDFIKELSVDDYEIIFSNIDINYIEYLVCQGGSVVFNFKNIAPINISKTQQFVALAKKYNLKTKRHNCDFHTDEEIKLLVDIGIDAFNFAPEFTYISNSVILNYLSESDKIYFFEIIKNSTPWERWIKDCEDINLSFLACGHYLGNDKIMKKYINLCREEIELKVLEKINYLYKIICNNN